MTNIFHTNKVFLTSVVLVAFILMAGLGLFMPVKAHMEHVDCPFAPGGTAVCAEPIAHLKNWQDAFLAILVETLVLVSVLLVFIKSLELFPKLNPQYERYRLQKHAPHRPSLLQELYSQGTLNRKAP